MDRLTEGCGNIGRSLSDSRGLLHSFRDCREQLLRLFEDLASMLGERCLSWEIACELRLKRARRSASMPTCWSSRRTRSSPWSSK